MAQNLYIVKYNNKYIFVMYLFDIIHVVTFFVQSLSSLRKLDLVHLLRLVYLGQR
jgi:hypothetical protein